MKKVVILIMICFLLTGCFGKVSEDKNQKYYKAIMNNVEVYSDVYLKDVIEENINDDITLVSDNYKIDTDTLGSHEYELYYKVKNKKYVYKFKLNTVDSKAPIVFSGTSKTVNIGYDGELCDLITYGDDYDGNIKCEITGDYDLNTAGTYKLLYKLSDSSNNVKEVNVTLTVRKPVTSGGTTTPTEPAPKIEFSDMLQKHKTSKTELGVDVSKWQGKIDYDKVKAAGASFVMMRIGVEGSSTRELSIDPFYEQNIEEAKKAGLKVGVYLYSIATSKEKAKEHAEWVIKTLNKEKLDLPIVFDWESWSSWNSYKISFHEINEIANTFIETVENKGYEGMLYSSKYYLETIWQNKKGYPVWLAHYTNEGNKTNYTGKYKMWQLCSDGHIDGINGDVDIDVLYLD